MSFTDHFDDAKQAAETAFQLVTEFGSKAHVPSPIKEFVGYVAAGGVLLTGIFYSAFLATVMFLAPEFAIGVLTLISDARNENPKELNAVATASLSELLGFELTSDDIPTGKGAAGTIARVNALGGKLHDQLIREFAPNGTVTPASGEQAARTFTGFNINFAVGSAFMAILGEIMSAGEFKEFRELGISVAQSLGLGRMHRAALKPLIDNTIAKPYDRLLRARYRQDVVSEKQLVVALHTGAMSEADVRQAFAEKGYPDVQITELIRQLTTHLGDSDLWRLMRYGEIDEAGALAQLKAEGWPEATARLKIRASQLAKLDSQEASYVTLLETQAKQGWITPDLFAQLLDRTHLSDAEKTWERTYVGQILENPQVDITWSEVKAALVDGILDVDYLDQWLIRQGYSQDDRQALSLIAIKAVADADAKAAAAAAKAAQGHVKKLTVAQLKKLYVETQVTFAYAQQYLAFLGYTDSGIALLLIQFATDAKNAADLATAQALFNATLQAAIADAGSQPSA